MKYLKEDYEETEFYSPDEDMQNHKQRVVKTRIEHKCCQCQQVINPGEMALLETCFLDGPQSAHTCIPCCDKWLDEVEGEAET
jgi:hypothetical protein